MARINGWMKTNRLAAGIIVAVVAVMVLGALPRYRKGDGPAVVLRRGLPRDGTVPLGMVHRTSQGHQLRRLSRRREPGCARGPQVRGDERGCRTLHRRHHVPPRDSARGARRALSALPREPQPQIPGFNHAEHSKGKPCVQCHAEAGHTVTPAALLEAGILNAGHGSRSRLGRYHQGGCRRWRR